MPRLTKRDTPDRSKINLQHAAEVKCWTKELGVSAQELSRAIDKVGNSAAAVRKELAATASEKTPDDNRCAAG